MFKLKLNLLQTNVAAKRRLSGSAGDGFLSRANLELKFFLILPDSMRCERE